MTCNLCRIDLSILRGRCGTVKYHPVFNLKNYKALPGVKSDQNHVDKRILGGKGLQYKGSTSITFVRPVYLLLATCYLFIATGYLLLAAYALLAHYLCTTID